MHQYPALLNLATQTLHHIGFSESFLVGRNDTADVCILDVACSRHHFRVVRRDDCHYVERLNAQNPTYHNGQIVAAPELLKHGSILQAGTTRFKFVCWAASDGMTEKAADILVPLHELPPMMAGIGDDVHTTATFRLTGVMLIGRDQASVQILLPHPQVSRRHACIASEGRKTILTDLNSANGTFINGNRIRGAVTLRAGDQLDIGPYALQFTGAELIPRPRSDNVELVARGIKRVVKNRETGKPMTLLDDISLVIRPHEFVCLLGSSGSGKSTLLWSLSGRATPDDGTVLINGRNLHANFEAIKQDIAVVPQKDVLHDSLAVEQVLWYTAKLRLPSDTSASEIAEVLNEMLRTVGLIARRATMIRHLSGGQVKRASLANEILCKPSLVFLDEVTSGLDEQTDREIMNLFRKVADAGKTVVCITHSLANVERTCHLVVILTPGGKLAFVGKPAEALEYFGIDRLNDVYDRLAQKSAYHWQQAFRNSPYWKRYVNDRLPAESRMHLTSSSVSSRSVGKRLHTLVRQTILLTARYAAIWRGDVLSLLAMIGQAFVVAVLLGLLFGNLDSLPKQDPHERAVHAQRSVNLLFLLAVSSFWFGCNNAAKEIVKERTIFTRERDFNLMISSYYTSKLMLLAIFSGLQTVLLLTIVWFWCALPGSFAGELTVLLLLAFTGVTIGLAISALSETEEMAITLIPMAVIPQIILSGAIAPLGGWSKTLASIAISTYWGKCGLDACLPEGVAQAMQPTPLEQHSVGVTLLMLLVHAIGAIVLGLAALHWQNRR